jgi:hypothetical protein
MKSRRAELYNLRDDLSETKNLATQEPGRVKTLLTELQAWQTEVGALMPTKNTAYDSSKPNGRGNAKPAPKAPKKGKK